MIESDGWLYRGFIIGFIDIKSLFFYFQYLYLAGEQIYNWEGYNQTNFMQN